VITQKQIEHPPILEKIQESLATSKGDKDASQVTTITEPSDVEYEDQGTLPEGAFLFRDHVAFLHVDKRGRIKQIDLVKKRAKSSQLEPPTNKEFKNMLIQDVKEHEWDELVALFLKNH
jgi:hypothetical protein